LKTLQRQLWQISNLGLKPFLEKVLRLLPRFPRNKVSSQSVSELATILRSGLESKIDLLEQREELCVLELKKTFQNGDFISYQNLGRERGLIRDERARLYGFDPELVRVVGSSFLGPLGHSALLDVFAKCKALGLMNYERLLLVVDEARLSNRSLVQLWRDHYDFSFIDEREWLDIEKIFGPVTEKADFIRTTRGYVDSMSLWDEANRAWELRGHEPLLSLPEGLADKAQSVLVELGLPREYEFVALHVREDFESNRPLGRNASIETYLDAIKEIVDRGYFVVRMGDSTMMPLPKMPMVIDYAHATKKADWIDVYLWSSCKFFVGTGSGPGHVPGVFGRPVLLTNVSAPGIIFPYSTKALMVPKSFVDNDRGMELRIDEALGRGAGWNWSPTFADRCIQMRDNSSYEIHQAVCDMFDSLSTENLPLTTGQIRFNELRRKVGSQITTPCAPSFAERYV